MRYRRRRRLVRVVRRVGRGRYRRRVSTRWRSGPRRIGYRM